MYYLMRRTDLGAYTDSDLLTMDLHRRRVNVHLRDVQYVFV